ncbi:hypothetical protein LJ737_19890 [Hymenobacter sp. 15J16-1T3B]|uniref:hypothetical protein n=1 Tax=Hymenobacter sp. 15J16-1T3B TaxID=2886941 RepID=UPI001D12BF7B|nr:hypothetical protein [Hymenobacter sp. 15J16-1T3B]MCC3159514.1 hypothetical protein [Hymenobacter sp. 15J16-1T3B]
MRRLALVTALLLASVSSCKLLDRPSPQEKLAALVEQHPELTAPETLRLQVPVVVPQVEVRTVYRPSPADSARHAFDLVRLDSLLHRAEVSLDSAQRAAATSRIRQWIRAQPVPLDTLCFDTLGVQGNVWYARGAYQLWLVRKELHTTAPATVVQQQLRPCPAAPVFAWYDPQGWPWYWVFLAGIVVGVGLSYGLFYALLHFLSRR